MSALAALQRQFREAVLGEPAGTGGLRLYQHAYRARLVAALRDNFGVLPRAMGDEAFEALALAYLREHPSQQPSIRWFGDQLATFMAARPGLVPHPALVDLARMEWALRSAFDAADAAPLEAAALAALPASAWPQLALRFHPSVQVLRMQWRIEPAWRALQASEAEPELAEPEPGEHLLLVWRPRLETRWRSVGDEVEAALLSAAQAGEPFGALCERAAAHVGEGEAASAAVRVLQQWVGEGLLVAPQEPHPATM